jgi:putative hydrolase of the HAD superfamily
MIEGLVFDVGGVLVRTQDQSGRHRWEARLGLKPGSLAWLVFDSELGRQAQLGQASMQEVWNWIGDLLDLSQDDLATMEFDFWSGDEVDQALCDYIRRLRVRYRTGMLSNNWVRDGRAMAEGLGIADCFDAFVTSAEIGVMKPEPRIYRVMLERLGLSPSQVIFVDDFSENVEAARRLGMHSLQFVDPVQAQSQLEKWLKR